MKPNTQQPSSQGIGLALVAFLVEETPPRSLRVSTSHSSGKETTWGRLLPVVFLNVVQGPGLFYVKDVFDLIWVCFDSLAYLHKTYKLP